jgi:hypothetical protein
MMRVYASLAAAAIAIAAAVASFTPAQATVRAAPAGVVQESAASVQLVHDRRYRQDRRHYRRYGHRRHHRHYGHRRYYQPYAYYGYPRYYSRPGVSFQFSFGGGHGYYGY